MSEMMHGTERSRKEEDAAPMISDDIEECDAEISVAAEIDDTAVREAVAVEIQYEEAAGTCVPVYAEAERIEDIVTVPEDFEVTEAAETIPGTVDIEIIEVTETVPETVEVENTEPAEAIPGTVDIEMIEVTEAIPDDVDAEMIEVTEAITDDVDAEMIEVTETIPDDVDAEMIEVTEIVPETVDVEAAEAAETIPGTVDIEIAEVPVVDIIADVTEDTAVEEEAVTEPPSAHYIEEIENDAPAIDVPDNMHEDDAEENMSALLNGIAVDDGIAVTEDAVADVNDNTSFAPEMPVDTGLSEISSETEVLMLEMPANVEPEGTSSETSPTEVIPSYDENAISFSFLSEGTPSPSADIRFFWGR